MPVSKAFRRCCLVQGDLFIQLYAVARFAGVDSGGPGTLFFTPFPDIVGKQAFQFCRPFLGPIDSAKGWQREKSPFGTGKEIANWIGKSTFSKVLGKVVLLNFAKI